MISKDELIARQAKELAALTRQHEIAAAMPFPPRHVTSEDSAAPWVSYQVKTLAEAVEMFRAFLIMPMNRYKKTFTRVCPAALMSKRDVEQCGDALDGPYACAIEVDQLQANGDSPRAKLGFFALTEAGSVHVHIEFGAGYIGACPGLTLPVHIGRGYRDQIESRTYQANPHLYALSDRQIYFASGDYGPVKTSANHAYLFMADQDENKIGAEQSHALGMLANLADCAKV